LRRYPRTMPTISAASTPSRSVMTSDWNIEGVVDVYSGSGLLQFKRVG
jgi:hypothetical protein